MSDRETARTLLADALDLVHRDLTRGVVLQGVEKALSDRTSQGFGIPEAKALLRLGRIINGSAL